MKDSDSNKFLVLLLAALALYFPLSAIPSTPDQQSLGQPQSPSLIQVAPLETPTPAPTPSEGRVHGEAAKLLCDYFGLPPDLDQDAQGRNSGQEQAQPNAIQNSDSKKLKGDYCRIKAILGSDKLEHPAVAGYKIEYLIATVPDPKDSRLDHLFDRYLDAIQRAIGAADYVFDSYWLPWDRSKTAAPVVLPSDPKTPQIASATRHLYEPGVILYRYNKSPSSASNSDNKRPCPATNSDNKSSSPDNRLLLLFLVGETPTGGIHRGAFKDAVRQIEAFAGWGESKTDKAAEEPAEKELRVISPSFSGSDESLAILLKEWIHGNEKRPRVRVISGTATSMEDFLDKFGPDKYKVSFHSTVIRSELATKKFYQYLRGLDSQIDPAGDAPRIAFLSETSTASGQRAREQSRSKRSENQRTDDDLPKILNLTFPLHISQLRVEAAKRASSREDATNALAGKEPDLELPMREAGSPVSKDIVPLFSPVETVTMKLTLDQMLSAIHREGIRYVGVRATDVQDRIFLVREINKQCPNAMIFIHNNNDLLYLHSDSNIDFRGALVLSTYPIFWWNQLWTYPFKGNESRAQFSTQAAQGIYNATLALLDKSDKKDLMLEYGLPFHKYGDCEPRYPTLWLGVVGRNRIWPVNIFDIFAGENPSEETCYNLPVPATSSSSGNGSSSNGKTTVPRPGLSDIYWSPTGNGILLLIAIIFLFLTWVYLAQLFLFWGLSKVNKDNPGQWREVRSQASREAIKGIFKFERDIDKGKGGILPRYLAWIRRGWISKGFGEEKFYCYRLDRRINLMSGFVCLLTITLFILSVAMLPACAENKITKGVLVKSWCDRHLLLGAMAGTILVLTLFACGCLAIGIFGWLIRRRRQLRGRIRVWLALIVGLGIIAFVSGWYRHPPFSGLAGTILVLTLFAFFWLAAGVIKWVILGITHLHGRIGAGLALIVAGMIVFVSWCDRHLLLGGLTGTILVLTLFAFFWVANGAIGWVSRRRHLRGRIGAGLALIVGAVMIISLGLGLIKIFSAEPYEQIFFFLRATEVRSGVSIMLPVLLVGLAAFLSFFAAARRLKLAEGMPCLREPQQCRGDAPQFLFFEHEQTKSFKGLKVLEDNVKETIVCPIFEVPGAWAGTVVILIVYYVLFVNRFIPSVDGWGFDCFFKLGFYIVPLLLVLALTRLFWLWMALRGLLQRLSLHPLISQYAAAHSEEKRFKLLQPVDLMTHTPTSTALSLSVGQAKSFYSALKLSPEQAQTAETIKPLVEKAEIKLSAALEAEGKGAWQEAMEYCRESQTEIAKMAGPVTGLLEESWRTADGAAPDSAAPDTGRRSASKSRPPSWQEEGKFFLITHIVAFLQHIFEQMHNLILWVTIGLLLLLIAATTYPFRPRESLLLFSWVGILTSVGLALFIFVKLNRDKTLSILARTTPGKLNITPEFVIRVVVVGVLPVIALLGAQFPEAVSRIFSWLSGFGGKGH